MPNYLQYLRNPGSMARRTGQAVQVLETMAGAFGAAYAAQKLGTGGKPKEVFGVSIELAAGAALTGLALTGAGGPRFDDDLLNFAAGAAAAWATRQGLKQAGGATISGDPPDYAGYIGATPTGNYATDQLLAQAGLLAPGYYGG